MMRGHGHRRILGSNVSPVSSIKLRTQLNILGERERGSASLIRPLRLRFVNLLLVFCRRSNPSRSDRFNSFNGVSRRGGSEAQGIVWLEKEGLSRGRLGFQGASERSLQTRSPSTVCIPIPIGGPDARLRKESKAKRIT